MPVLMASLSTARTVAICFPRGDRVETPLETENIIQFVIITPFFFTLYCPNILVCEGLEANPLDILGISSVTRSSEYYRVHPLPHNDAF